MKKFAKLLAVCLAVMALAGCSLVTVNPEKITVATVGGDTITKAQFDEQFNAFLAQYGYTQESEEIADQMAELKESFINQMVEERVIDQKVRELGFKPYIAPGLSSACVSVLQALRGQFHYGTVPIGGVCFGCRSRYTPYGLELERLPLAAQLRQRIAVSYADLKEMESQCRL